MGHPRSGARPPSPRRAARTSAHCWAIRSRSRAAPRAASALFLRARSLAEVADQLARVSSHFDRLRASAAAARGTPLREQTDRREHVVPVHDDLRVLGQLPPLGRDTGQVGRARGPRSRGRRGAGRHPSRRAERPRAGPCRCARRPGRQGRPRRGSGRRGGAGRAVAAAEASSSSSRRSASLVGRKDGSAVRRTAARGVLVEQACVVPGLPGARGAPAHAEVALDGAGDRGRRDHLAGEPGVLRVEAHDGVHVGRGARRCRRPPRRRPTRRRAPRRPSARGRGSRPAPSR